jgi:hypothetical protein
MKRILMAIFAALAISAAAFAQTAVTVVNPGDWGPWLNLTAATGNNERCVDLNGKVITDHTFNYQPLGGPSAITVTIIGVKAGTQADVTTGTTTSGGTIHFTGTYNTLCFHVTTLTGAGSSVNGSYAGGNSANAGAVTVSGDVTVVQPTGSNLHVVVDSGGGGGSTAQGAAIAGVTGGMSMVSTTTSAPTYSTATVNPLNGQTDGSLRVANTAALPAGSAIIGNVRIDQTTPGTTNGVAIADAGDVTLGAKADAKSTATDTTAVTLMSVAKEMSFQLQAIAALASTDPCSGVLTTPVDLHLASTTVTQLIAATSAKKNYICSMDIVVGGTAEIISLVEGDSGGANCGTNKTAVWGSATAASGFPFGANGGIARSKTITGIGTNKNTCVQSSGSNAFTIHIEYVQQ